MSNIDVGVLVPFSFLVVVSAGRFSAIRLETGVWLRTSKYFQMLQSHPDGSDCDNIYVFIKQQNSIKSRLIFLRLLEIICEKRSFVTWLKTEFSRGITDYHWYSVKNWTLRFIQWNRRRAVRFSAAAEKKRNHKNAVESYSVFPTRSAQFTKSYSAFPTRSAKIDQYIVFFRQGVDWFIRSSKWIRNFDRLSRNSVLESKAENDTPKSWSFRIIMK